MLVYLCGGSITCKPIGITGKLISRNYGREISRITLSTFQTKSDTSKSVRFVIEEIYMSICVFGTKRICGKPYKDPW